MKELEELNLPGELMYSKDHEWAKKEDDTIVIGITDYAQDQLGDIVFAEMPEVGSSFEQGEEFGTLESVKAVSEIYLPVSGEIIAINDALEDEPELINEDPYENWIVVVRPSKEEQFDKLLSREEYLETLTG
ncbi:MAG: glycine cleavage system protein GcvH [Desulfofustis sp. PB-SRB1]|jgi:glycine cleavage system H protein|nr:glycine cleavage system protein GcvH [Desulfofustis sp. PB-SRB1]MBM1002502.1 glycine cleavage system protein GcvH [Desulfofustis sp. PB-SRB1]HBH27634.1 glycine cleavage system protein GcvH [Desulfofustis sp.]HBH31513.1 glycine cleavage system protein GcvH [Desulfofustis sp.]